MPCWNDDIIPAIFMTYSTCGLICFVLIESHWSVCKSICILIKAIHLCRAYEHIVLVHYRDVLEV